MNRRIAKRFSRQSPSLFPEDNLTAKVYDHHADFHHQLKARTVGVRSDYAGVA